MEGDFGCGALSEWEILDQSQQLFQAAPIPFKARKSSPVDLELKRMVDEMNITIPIVWIQGSLYLVGSIKLHLHLKGEYVIAKIGGGFQKFE